MRLSLHQNGLHIKNLGHIPDSIRERERERGERGERERERENFIIKYKTIQNTIQN